MNVTHIPVEYPTTIVKVIFTEAEMRAKGYKNYKGDKTTNVYVNRPIIVKVKQVKRLVQEEFMTSEDYNKELDDMSVAQTGKTRADYQASAGKAWNE